MIGRPRAATGGFPYPGRTMAEVFAADERARAVAGREVSANLPPRTPKTPLCRVCGRNSIASCEFARCGRRLAA